MPRTTIRAEDITDSQVGSAEIATDAVDTAEIKANAVDTSEIAANAVDTSEIAANAVTLAEMADDAVGVAQLSATGTADATTFLRGDNSWTAAGGDNTPAFQAYLSSNQDIDHASTDKVLFDTEDFDTDGAYDNTTNHRFTVPAGEGGKYFVYFRLTIEGGNTKNEVNTTYINVNGSAYLKTNWNFKNNPGEIAAPYNAGIITLAAADYVECSVYLSTADSSAGEIHSANRATVFGAYKLIGI